MEFSKNLIGIPVAVIVAVGTKKQRIVEPGRDVIQQMLSNKATTGDRTKM